MEFTPKLPPDERKAVIITAAVEVANEKGIGELTFQNVAEACRMKTTVRTVCHYFKIGELRQAVINDERANKMVRDDAVALGWMVKQ